MLHNYILIVLGKHILSKHVGMHELGTGCGEEEMEEDIKCRN
jgi:hypothetical protein